MTVFGRLSFLTVAMLLSCSSALALISRPLERRFTIPEGETPRFRMSVFFGSVQIEPGEGRDIVVKIRQDFEAENDEQAENIARHLVLKVEQNGPEVFIGAEYKRTIHWTSENWPPVKLTYTITVPKHCDLDLHTRDGSLTVGRLAGEMKAKTHWGVIFFKGVEGNVEAGSEFGDIVVSHCKGNLKLRSISGNFHVGPVSGFADVFGYGGEIEVQSAGGGVHAETSGADLAVGFRHPIVAPASLKTGGANIVITLDRRSSCLLELKSSIFGRVENVENALPLKALSGALGKSRVTVQLNDGGPKIAARASGGFVYLQAAPQE